MSNSKVVVLDTHVFLAGVSEAEQRDEAAVRVYRHAVESCYRFAVNERITEEYQLKVQRFGITGQILRDTLSHLKRLGKLQRTGKFGGRRPIAAGPEQDRPFIECAIGADANYVITRDPDFEAFENMAREHDFEIVSPERYLRKEGQG